jgi:hypothetical protein
MSSNSTTTTPSIQNLSTTFGISLLLMKLILVFRSICRHRSYRRRAWKY